MRNIQEIFDTVIDSGFYKEETESTGRGNKYMCNAIWFAKITGVINDDEWMMVNIEISQYLNPNGIYSETPTLNEMLTQSGIEASYETRLNLFRNWEKRPALKY